MLSTWADVPGCVCHWCNRDISIGWGHIFIGDQASTNTLHLLAYSFSESHVFPSPTPGPSTCLPNYFRCSSGACVMGTWVCDGYRDCADGSDEEACPSLANSTAASTPTQLGQCDRFEFECRQPKKCIPNWKRCDGHQDCQDGQDEANCREYPLTAIFQSPEAPLPASSLGSWLLSALG